MAGRLSYWLLPILSGAVWLGMLLGMIIGWVVDLHREHTSSMDPGQYIPYISDIGATSRFKPMFIALSAVTTVTLDLAFVADRWLRHAGRLTPNGSAFQKALGVLTIVFAVIGTAGLILLAIFDVAHHKTQHDGLLLCFIGGYVLSAVFICWEYQRLGVHHRDVRIIATSFWIKLAFVLIEVVLAIVFASLTFTSHTNAGAAVEWVIAVFFAFYVFSFSIDLYPAVHTRRNRRYHADAEKHAADRAAAADRPAAMVADGEPDYYGDTYGQSAARATRAPRANRSQANGAATAPVPVPAPVASAFEEDLDHPAMGSQGHAVELPASSYQPGRTY